MTRRPRHVIAEVFGTYCKSMSNDLTSVVASHVLSKPE